VRARPRAARIALRAGAARRLSLSALSGTLAFLSFAPHAYYPLAFVAFVPLLTSVTEVPPPRALLLGLAAGVVGHAGGFVWVLPAIARFEGVSTLAALPFFLLFLFYHALPFAFFAAGACRLTAARRENALEVRRAARRSRGFAFGGPVRIASLWVVLEWMFPRVIPWHLGSTLGPSRLLRQGADLAGVYGLSFLVMVVNALLAGAWMARRRWVVVLRCGTAAVLAVSLAAAYGALRLRSFNARETATLGPLVTVAAVQGDLRSGGADIDAANEEAWAVYSTLTERRIAGDADLVIWPETVLRVYLRQDADYQNRLDTLATNLRHPLLVGALDVSEKPEGELNSVYLIAPSAPDTGSRLHAPVVSTERGLSARVYHKTALLPFGEYVPGARVFPFLRRWRTTGEFVSVGTPRVLCLPLARFATPSRSTARCRNAVPERRVDPSRGVAFAPSVCIEAVRPGWFNAMVRRGARFLVNVTDDGWFGDTAAPYQHLELARLRAVETRRWLVRASNSGISAFIDPAGRIVTSLPLHARGVLRRRVRLEQSLTPYVRTGDRPFILFCAAWSVFPSLAGACSWLQRRR